MRLRLIGVTFLVLALGACGGGGSGPPSVPPTPTPSPARPAKSGDAFTYAGTLVRSFGRNPEPGRPIPTPIQSNAQTFTSAVTQKVAVSNGATFGSATGLTDFTTVETDVQVSPTKTTTMTSDAYSRYPTGPSGSVTGVATVTTTSDGARFVTTFGAGNGLIDVLPEVPGPIGPANSAALTTTENDPDGTVTTRQTNADGSYVETSKYPDGTSATATEAADATGVYSIPLFGLGTSPASPTTPNTQLTVGAPVVVASPAPPTFYIPIRIVYAPGLLGPGPVTVNRLVKDWYPTLPPAPLVLSSETYTNNGAQAIPAACNVPAALAVTGNQLQQNIYKVDTLFGDTETLSTTSYVAAAGVVCMQLADTVTQYYDYSGQTQRFLATFGTPLQTTTITETVGLTAETLLSGARLTDAARGGVGVLGTNVAILQNFTALLERRRLERHAAALRALRLPGAR